MSIRALRISKVSMAVAILSVIAAIACGSASAVVFPVTTTGDSGPGTLRDALLAANAAPGHDSIVFQIDRDDPSNDCAIAVGDLDKVCQIRPVTVLPTISDPITIDGRIPESRSGVPGSVTSPLVEATERPGIELNGELLPFSTTPAAGLALSGATGSTIRGLVINRFPGPGIFALHSSNVRILGNYVGADATGTLASSWNATATACLANCFGNRGTANVPNGYGILAGQGNDIQVGGAQNNERNVVANNYAAGVSLFEATNSTIAGNFLGSDVYGLEAAGNRQENAEIRGFTGSSRTTFDLLPLFGTDVGSSNNRIESNLALDSQTRAGFRLLGRQMLFKTSAADPGVVIPNAIAATTIADNLVGSNLGGEAVPNFQSAISISDRVIDSRIGFDVADGQVKPAPNTIAYNPGGIVINTAPQAIFINGTPSGALLVVRPEGNGILYNQVHGNGVAAGSLGIDLAGTNLFTGDGVTAIDLLDADSGPNDLQNFPLLSAANQAGTTSRVTVTGSLRSTPKSAFLLQFFANDEASTKTVQVSQETGPQPVLLAQGGTYLGSARVNTDGRGVGQFMATLTSAAAPLPRCSIDGGPPGRTCITATATQLSVKLADGYTVEKIDKSKVAATSEFSPAVSAR